MKILLILGLFCLVGCSKFSTLKEYSSSNVVMTIDAYQVSTTGQVPLTQGCYVELLSEPVDGGLMMNYQTGEFEYIFQDLSVVQSLTDQFSYRQVCPSGYGKESLVIIDTYDIIH